MKKRIRNLLCLFLCCVLAISSRSSRAYAAESCALGEDETNTSVQVYEKDDGTEVKVITKFLSYDEAIELLMEKKNITETEAEAILGPRTSTMSTRSTSFATKIVNYKFHTYVVEVGAIWEVYNSGSFRQFNSFKEAWSGAVGSGSYTWNQFYAIDKTPSYPCVTAIAEARGVIEVNLDFSYSTTIGAELLGMGFDHTGTVGQTYTYRKTATLGLVWELYPEPEEDDAR